MTAELALAYLLGVLTIPTLFAAAAVIIAARRKTG